MNKFFGFVTVVGLGIWLLPKLDGDILVKLGIIGTFLLGVLIFYLLVAYGISMLRLFFKI